MGRNVRRIVAEPTSSGSFTAFRMTAKAKAKAKARATATAKATAKAKARARAEADPPFGFAQGRLFGDDNQKGKGKSPSASLRAGSSTAFAARNRAKLRSG
jgi:FKBP-type peptidyl-prolyl cis-trans isomerase